MNENFRASLLALSFGCLAAPAGVAFAHTQDGSLGAGAAATDYYQATCSDDGSGTPASMIGQVQNRGPAGAPAVSVLVQKANSATSSTDVIANNTTGQSPLVWINGADGVYNIFVTKSGDGPVNYTLTYHCYTAANGGGIHTGTIIVTKQNQ